MLMAAAHSDASVVRTSWYAVSRRALYKCAAILV